MIIEVLDVVAEAKSVKQLIEEKRGKKLRQPIPPIKSITFRLMDEGQIYADTGDTAEQALLLDAAKEQIFASLDNANLNGIRLLSGSGMLKVAVFATY